MSEILQTEETVKLYEYELIKPDLEDELAHHGVLGQKWGLRNGPPYPLSKIISTGKKLKASIGKISKKRKRKQAIKKAKKTRLLKQKQLEEKKKLQRSKEEVMKANDIKTMFNNIKDYSNDDIKRVLDRLDWEDKLKRKVSELEKANQSRWKKFKSNIKEGASQGIDRTTKDVSSRITSAIVRKGAEEGLKYLFTDDPNAVINKQFISSIFNEGKGKNKNQNQDQNNNLAYNFINTQMQNMQSGNNKKKKDKKKNKGGSQ